MNLATNLYSSFRVTITTTWFIDQLFRSENPKKGFEQKCGNCFRLDICH